MTYNELRVFCAKMRVPVDKIAEESGLTFFGLKNGLTKESLALRYILPLCKALCISPNEFFGVSDITPKQQIQNGGRNNRQVMDGTAVAALEQQLRAKDEQIKTLLDIIAKK